jgi:hypothetical protein
VVDFPYRAVGGLIAIADEFWPEIDGACALVGVDPLGLTFPRFLNLIYAWVCQRIQGAEGAREQLDEALFTPVDERGLRDPDNVAPEVIEEEMALFRAASMSLRSEMG